MNKYLPALSVFILISCGTEQPLTTRKAENNRTYTVEYLFEHEGCKVYRFWDFGHYIYFTNCTGETTVRTDSTEVRNRTIVKQHFSRDAQKTAKAPGNKQ
jgi:hypothetical protein